MLRTLCIFLALSLAACFPPTDDGGGGGGGGGGGDGGGGDGGGGGGQVELSDGSLGSSCGSCEVGLECAADASVPNGYCTRACSSHADCSPLGYCYQSGTGGQGICFRMCSTDADCRPGYTCTGDPSATACAPGGGGGGTPTTSFVNGDFEQGSGVGWTEEPAGLIIPASQLGGTAVSGTQVGWLGYAPDSRTVVRLSQTVIVPPPPVTLDYFMWLYSEELCDPPWWDTLGLYVNGDPIIVNDSVCSANNTDGWEPMSHDLSSWSGQTVTIMWEFTTAYGDALASMVALDDVRFVH